MATIKAKKAFGRLKVPDLLARGRAVAGGFKGNVNFTTPPPPVDPDTLKAALDDLDAKQAESLDGGKKAIEARNKAKAPVVKMLDQLANHAETYCKDDKTIFLTSGFETKSTTKTPPAPLDQPTIESVDQGNTGQAVVKINPVKGARSYVIQFGGMGPGGTPPTTWSTTPAIKSKPPTKINGLTPGTT